MEYRKQCREIKPCRTGTGYLSVQFTQGGSRAYVHRLVAAAFVPNLTGAPHINHRNGNKQDNRADNLEWVTRSQNMKHATQVLGRRGGQFGPGRVRHAARSA